MVKYRIILSNPASKDTALLQAAGLEEKTRLLLAILENNPFQNPPPYEKLRGNLAGFYSRRITLKHRLVYQVVEPLHEVHILRMWTHYGD
jgi:toxin YoeB